MISNNGWKVALLLLQLPLNLLIVNAWSSLALKSIYTIHQNLSGRSRKMILPHSLASDTSSENDIKTEVSPSNSKTRRSFFQTAASLSAAIFLPSVVSNPAVALAKEATISSSGQYWPLGKVAFSLLPLAGTYSRRATVEEEVVKDCIWTHDQIQGVVNVNVPVRQVVVKLSEEAGGGLWVHNPVAPTPELLSMMKELEAKHGPVRHIVLGTVALEHKATFGPFCSNFPKATVWIQPGQWSFPVNLPPEFLGITQRGPKFRELPIPNQPSSSTLFQHFADIANINNKNDPEWIVDISYETLGPLEFRSVGGFSESAFFHSPTKTLIVTDTVCSVTSIPPKIIQEDPRAMLFHARDDIFDAVVDDVTTREKGWRRMVQFGLVFFPSQIDVIPFSQALREARGITDPFLQSLGEDAIPFNLYPWKWKSDDADVKNFHAIAQNGTLFCPPILTKLILDREPEKTLQWVDRVCSRFHFKRIITAHLNNNVNATPSDFKNAFRVLENDPKNNIKIPQRPLDEDLALLQKASDFLTRFGVVGESKVCDGEPARLVGRFASP